MSAHTPLASVESDHGLVDPESLELDAIPHQLVDKMLDVVSAAVAGARLAYAPAELADLLGVSRAWIYLRLDDGTIPSVKLGAKRLIRASVIEALLAGNDLSHGGA